MFVKVNPSANRPLHPNHSQKYQYFADTVPSAMESDLRSLLADVPGEGWQDGVLELVSSVDTELRSILASYGTAEGNAEDRASAEGQHASAAILLPLSGWLELCVDARLQLGPEELTLIFAGRSASPEEHPPEPPEPLDLLLFQERIVRLCLAMKGGDFEGTAQDATNLLAVLRIVLHSCLLPFARRDTSSGFCRVLGVKPAHRQFLEQTKASFSGNGAPAASERNASRRAESDPALGRAQASRGQTGSRSGSTWTRRACRATTPGSGRSSACSPSTSGSSFASSASTPSSPA